MARAVEQIGRRTDGDVVMQDAAREPGIDAAELRSDGEIAVQPNGHAVALGGDARQLYVGLPLQVRMKGNVRRRVARNGCDLGRTRILVRFGPSPPIIARAGAAKALREHFEARR